MGEELQGKERQSSPSHPGIKNWGVGNSFLGVNKWGRCCKVGRGRVAPTSQAAATIGVWGTVS